jgi:hypothetical protein
LIDFDWSTAREHIVADLLQAAAEKVAERDHYKQVADELTKDLIDKESTRARALCQRSD